MKSTPLFKISDLSYKYKDTGKYIFNDMSLDVMAGDFIILIGPNGSGKSTFFKLLMGIYEPSGGHISFNNKLSMSYISQKMDHSLFMDMTVEENLKLLLGYEYNNNIKDHLSLYNRNLPLYLDKQVNSLSGGEKQALVLAIKLFKKTDLLLLDEHTSALDPETESQVMNITNKVVSDNNITTIMCTHNLNFIGKYGNRILGLKNGKFIFDKSNYGSSDLKEFYNVIYL